VKVVTMVGRSGREETSLVSVNGVKKNLCVKVARFDRGQFSLVYPVTDADDYPVWTDFMSHALHVLMNSDINITSLS